MEAKEKEREKGLLGPPKSALWVLFRFPRDSFLSDWFNPEVLSATRGEGRGGGGWEN